MEPIVACDEPRAAFPERADASDPAELVTFTVDRVGEATVLRVRGELDMLSAPLLTARLAECIGGGPRMMVLDLAAVTFCSSSGLRALLQARDLAGQRGIPLRLAQLSTAARRSLTVSGLVTLFEIHPDVAAALS